MTPPANLIQTGPCSFCYCVVRGWGQYPKTRRSWWVKKNPPPGELYQGLLVSERQMKTDNVNTTNDDISDIKSDWLMTFKSDNGLHQQQAPPNTPWMQDPQEQNCHNVDESRLHWHDIDESRPHNKQEREGKRTRKESNSQLRDQMWKVIQYERQRILPNSQMAHRWLEVVTCQPQAAVKNQSYHALRYICIPWFIILVMLWTFYYYL